MLNEAKIIANLKAKFPEHIGDDAAIIEQTGNQSYVVTKDLLVEDVHFRTSYFAPLNLAHKALHVNLSDLAAMGATPKFVLLGISMPMSQQKYVEDFVSNFTAVCKAESVILIGGDTTKSADKIFISITAIGTALTGSIKRRNSAKTEDLICVVGDLGAAHLGFIASEQSLVGFEDYKKAFLHPTARVNEGIWLGKQEDVTSLMDISDGLFVDLKRLCEASALQGTIDLARIKPDKKFCDACEALEIDPIETMISGGEDYTLLFTVKESQYKEISNNFIQKFGYPIKQIGSVTTGEGVRFILNGQPQKLNLKSFSHFGESI